MKPGAMQRREIQKPESHNWIFPGFLAACLIMSWRAGAKPRYSFISYTSMMPTPGTAG
jgi:hypothetical protein